MQVVTTTFWRIALAFVLGVLGVLVASSAARAAEQPRCAVLIAPDDPLHKSPVAPLVEAALADRGLRLVERQQIAQVLKEQELSALTAAEGVGPRVRLGQILQADLLVFLATDPRAPGQLRLVACETASGIRLVHRGVPVEGARDDAGEAAAKSIAQAVFDAARQQAGPPRILCAVPPFVSKDLAYDHDAMKAAFATLTERAVATRTTALTVELAELRALEREILLGDRAQTKLTRPLPFYLLGDYRHDGTGSARRVTLGLSLKQGETELARVTRPTLAPDAAGAAIGEMVQTLLADRAQAAPAKVNPADELRQLVRRAQEFEKVGDWQEAVDLYEACLLLDPAHQPARRAVMQALLRLPRRGDARDQEARFQQVVLAHQRERRRYDHFEAFAARHRFAGKEWDLIDFSTANVTSSYSEQDKRIGPVGDQTRAAARDTIFRLIRTRLASGPDDALVDLLVNQELWWLLDGETEAAAFARLEALVRDLQGRPKSREWTTRLVTGYHSQITWYRRNAESGGKLRPAPTGERVDHVARLRALDVPVIHDALTEFERREAEVAELNRKSAEKSRAAAAAATRPKPPADGPVARLEPIDVRLDPTAAAADKKARLTYVSGWIAAGPGLDVLWHNQNLFLMREPGVATPVPLPAGTTVEVACFDGRYVWALGRNRDPRLLALDPATGQTWHFDQTDGLLPTNSGVAIAPLAPGKVFVSAGFQPQNVTTLDGRGWCAIATLNPTAATPTAAKSVNVFFEAKTLIKDDWVQKLSPPDTAFSPAYLHVIGQGADRRLILGRHAAEVNHYRCFTPPLVIDPEKLTVALWAADPKLPGKGNGPWTADAASIDGALVWLEPAFVEGRIPPRNWSPKIFRAQGPTARVSAINQLMNFGYDPASQSRAGYDDRSAVTHAGRLFYLARDLYELDPTTGAPQPLRPETPTGPTPLRRLTLSSHYGIVAWTTRPDPKTPTPTFHKLIPPTPK